MSNVIKCRWHVDAGHEWLAVKFKDLIDLGIALDISPYSYMRGKTAYLEGDCDAGLFYKAAEKRGLRVDAVQARTFPDRSPVRGYERYSGARVMHICESVMVVKQREGEQLAFDLLEDHLVVVRVGD